MSVCAACGPGDHVVDLQPGPVAAGVEADTCLLDEDRLPLFQGGQALGAADVEDVAGAWVDGDGGDGAVTRQLSEELVADLAEPVQQGRLTGRWSSVEWRCRAGRLRR